MPSLTPARTRPLLPVLLCAATLLLGAPLAQASAQPSAGVTGPSKKVGTWTARVLAGTAIRARPDGSRTSWYASGKTRWSGTSQRLMVLRSSLRGGRLWLKVRLPERPNGSAGWIPRDRVRLNLTRRYVTIDRSRRLLRVYRRGRLAASFRVVVGSGSTPTPLGLFAIYDRVPQGDPNGFVGSWVLPLTAHSEKLKTYEGGPGLVALHGRGGESLLDPLGGALSHGCVRMNNRRIQWLARSLMKGTAVRIRA